MKISESIYPEWMKPIQKKKYKHIFLDFILPFSSKLKDWKILDVGIGNGWFEEELRDRGVNFEMFGIDVERKNPDTENFKYIVGDGNSLPVKPEFFDLVISLDTIHLLNNIADIENSVREGGYLLISIFAKEEDVDRKRKKILNTFSNLELLKEGIAGDPEREVSYVTLFKKVSN